MINNLISKTSGRLLVSSLLFLYLIVTDNYLSTSIGLAFSLYIFLLFISNLSTSVPVIELMSLLYVIQLIVSPYYSYLTNFEYNRYMMSVSEEVYMNNTVPLIISFYIPAILFKKKFVINEGVLVRFLDNNPKFPYLLIAIGLGSMIFNTVLPVALAFIAYLLNLLLYIGAIAIIYTNYKHKWRIFVIIMLFPLFKSINTGMFGQMVYIYVFVAMFLFSKFRLKTTTNLMMIVLFVFLINTLQVIKSSYREIAWYSRTLSNYGKVELFFDLMVQQLFEADSPEDVQKLDETINIRYNQGWIVSNIYAYIPEFSSSLGGKTIFEAIEASLIPRFISSSKKTVNDTKRDFELMTGITLMGNTSMATSIIGEAYGNFELYGGMAFLFVWGLIMAYVTRIFNKVISKYPYMIFFVPIIYLTTVRGSEGNFITILNWLVKSSVFLFFMHKIFTRYISFPSGATTVLSNAGN